MNNVSPQAIPGLDWSCEERVVAGKTTVRDDESTADRISRLLTGMQITRSAVGAGSILCMGFGHPATSIDGKGDVPAVTFMAFCRWRIFEDGTLTAAWRDPAGARHAHGVDALQRVLGQTVCSVRFSGNAADMTICVSRAIEIEIVINIADPVVSDPDASEDNYYLRAGSEAFTCAADGMLSSSN